VADVRRLPGPVIETWDWPIRAACRDLDSSVFFHPDRERGPARHGREVRAKRVCARCPVIDECRRHALTVQEPYGVWGGLTAGERTTILNRCCAGGRSARHG
jgi:WhiB family redox-sensing transcriptional regulator